MLTLYKTNILFQVLGRLYERHMSYLRVLCFGVSLKSGILRKHIAAANVTIAVKPVSELLRIRQQQRLQ